MNTSTQQYLERAEESLFGAESELVNQRYNNCANRCYYACFQAAIAALHNAAIRSSGREEWPHAFVQTQFVGQLINRRKQYPTALRTTLIQNQRLRHQADYETVPVSNIQAQRALARSREFVRAIREELSDDEA